MFPSPLCRLPISFHVCHPICLSQCFHFMILNWSLVCSGYTYVSIPLSAGSPSLSMSVTPFVSPSVSISDNVLQEPCLLRVSCAAGDHSSLACTIAPHHTLQGLPFVPVTFILLRLSISPVCQSHCNLYFYKWNNAFDMLHCNASFKVRNYYHY